METYLQCVAENWPTIIEYAILAVMYFLIELHKYRVTSTKRDLRTLFNEKAAQVTTTDTKLREEMRKELTEARNQYRNAVNEIKELKRQVVKCKNAVAELIAEVDDMEVYDARD